MRVLTSEKIQIGVDTGGTFTDIVCYSEGAPLGILKVPSSPENPSKAILWALSKLEETLGVSSSEISKFCHGTTVATNSLIEKKGGRIGILATEGFSDVLEIGRQMRQELYEAVLKPQAPIFLAPSRRRKEVKERVASDGSILVPLDEQTVLSAVEELEKDGIDAVAICFLFSFLNPAHEMRAKDIVNANFPNLKVSISSIVDPTFREYERTVVTAFDAYLKPVVDNYLSHLDAELKKSGLANEPKLMQSRGGMSAISIARQRPVGLFLSGPAAGVVGAASVGKVLGEKNLISIDIGGTSCDISVISDARPKLRTEGEIGGYPVRVNMVDVNAIGAGGGSLVWLDSAGGLRVGPDSAGANPGPACYGKGGNEATVTDASLVLGYLNPDFFAGGDVTLDLERARTVINDKIASHLGVSIERAAQGIHQVVNTQMAEGVRLISTQRGLDPRKFALVVLGGAGPVHGVPLAEELGIARIIVPRNPGVLSAIGLLNSPIEHEVVMSVQQNLADLSGAVIIPMTKKLDADCQKLMREEGVSEDEIEIHYLADLCYLGQSYFLSIRLAVDNTDMLQQLIRDFKAEHDRVYGHAADAPVRMINLRAVHSTRMEMKAVGSSLIQPEKKGVKGERSVVLSDSIEPVLAKIYDRNLLSSGDSIEGPAIIEQADTTTLVANHWRAIVHESEDIILTKILVKESKNED